MSRCSSILAVSLICVFVLHGKAAAEERVLRLQQGQSGFGGAITLRYPLNGIEYVRRDENYVLSTHTFTVYTAAEVNSIVSSIAAVNAQDASAIAELRGVMDSLRKNIQDLSDVNDALTKRVEELEKRLASR